MGSPIYSLREIPAPRSRACKAIMNELPDWFGLPEYIDRYAVETERLETIGAYSSKGELVGFMALRPVNHYCAEIHVMAVLPAHHGRGIGRLLVNHAVTRSRAEGCEFLEVKTLGPSKPDPHYEKTRAFYLNNGFRPLDELFGVWGENPCLIMVMAL